MESLQTVSLQNFFCIEGEISVISLYLTFVLLFEGAIGSSKYFKYLALRLNLISIYVRYFSFRVVRDPESSSDRSFQVSTSQDPGKRRVRLTDRYHVYNKDLQLMQPLFYLYIPAL